MHTSVLSFHPIISSINLVFSIESWDGGLISLRSGLSDYDDEQEESDVDSYKESAGRAFQPSNEGQNVMIRKSFPEAWIFDGNLNLGYKTFFKGLS